MRAGSSQVSPPHRGWGVPGAVVAGGRELGAEIGPFWALFSSWFGSGATRLPGGVCPCRAEAGEAWGGFVALWHRGSAFIYFYFYLFLQAERGDICSQPAAPSDTGS